MERGIRRRKTEVCTRSDVRLLRSMMLLGPLVNSERTMQPYRECDTLRTHTARHRHRWVACIRTANPLNSPHPFSRWRRRWLGSAMR